MEPSENQIFLFPFPSVLSQDGASRCSSCVFKPKAGVLRGGLELVGGVFWVGIQVFLGLDLQLVHWCGVGQKKLILIIQKQQK